MTTPHKDIQEDDMSTDHMSRSSYDMYMYMIYIIISSNVMKCCRDSKSGERGEHARAIFLPLLC